jgi:hypothetical protein
MDDRADPQDAIRREAEAALEYRRAIMRIRGWCAMLGIFGGLAIFQAFELMDAGVEIAWIGAVVGGLLILTAIAAAIKPCTRTMVMEAIAFVAIAAWDLGLAILSKGEAADLAIWGVIEAGIAIYLFVKLPSFIRIAAQRPSDEVMDRLAAVAEGIRKATVKEDPHLIEFKVGNARWRAKLADTVVTFVEAQKGADMVFVPRAEFRLEDHTAPGKDPKKRKVTLHASDRTWKTKLPREDFQRLREWESAGQQPTPAESA